MYHYFLTREKKKSSSLSVSTAPLSDLSWFHVMCELATLEVAIIFPIISNSYSSKQIHLHPTPSPPPPFFISPSNSSSLHQKALYAPPAIYHANSQKTSPLPLPLAHFLPYLQLPPRSCPSGKPSPACTRTHLSCPPSSFRGSFHLTRPGGKLRAWPIPERSSLAVVVMRPLSDLC